MIFEEQKPSLTFNLIPMIDFLFLMLAFFATIAVSRAALLDNQLELVKVKNSKATYLETHQITFSVSNKGQYKWIKENKNLEITLPKIQQEIKREYNANLIPKDKSQTKILLYIDKKAPWQPIAKLIFTIKELGFEAYPIYEN